MRGNVEEVKERLDIAEVLGGYLKLEKAGANFKAKCPFHNEKTASFFISPTRQSYYCFGCGEKGDIFTFVEKMEGVDFKEALKTLADRAGVALTWKQSENKGELENLHLALEAATEFFESKLKDHAEALKYLRGRGVSEESVKEWRMGFASNEWRSLREHMHAQGFADEVLLKSGLIKKTEGEPYDVFRDRIIFPLCDSNGRVIAFSGRALGKDTEPKYLNSPDTPLFTKSEVLYGLFQAKNDIRKKDYAVLVEGQLDLLLSHQAGVRNTVASSGTAFTNLHLERLKKLSSRIILAFDGDEAGFKAAERSAILALSLGLEVKVAKLPEGKDPADLVKTSPEDWKNALREAKPAIEVFLDEILRMEKDARKAGKMIEKKILPMILLLKSSIERAHFVSLIHKKTGIKEDVVWEDLKKTQLAPSAKEAASLTDPGEKQGARAIRSRKEELEEVKAWLKDNPDDQDLMRQKKELEKLLRIDEISEEILTAPDEKKIKLAKERDELRREIL